MDTLKSVGGTILGIVAFAGFIIGAVLLFNFGVEASIVAAPYIYLTAAIVFWLNVIILVFAVIPSARRVVGWILFISSFVYGLTTWIYGLLVTLSLWGIIAIIIGLFLGGVGVVPIGMLAAIFNGEWGIFFTLLILIVLTISTRLIGISLDESYGKRKSEEHIIDLQPEEVNQRSWKDLV